MADIEDSKGPKQDVNHTHSHQSHQSHVCTKKGKESQHMYATTLKPWNGVPGTQSIYIKTWGCSHNHSDSEYMGGLLSNYGYTVIIEEDRRDFADLWLLNSCTVKGPSEVHFLNMVRRAKNRSKYIVAAGCVPQGDKKIDEIQGVSIVGVQQIDKIVDVVKQTFDGNTVQLFAAKRIKDETGNKRKRKDGGAKLNLPKIRRNPLIEIIPINTGCLNTCTYCKTKHARGDLGSYAVSEIIDRIKHVITHEKIKEIWLTSEDTGAYGLDINTNIAQLLNQIVSVLNEEQYKNRVMIRIGMTNPPYILAHLDAISEALNHPNIYAFLHIPVQSGSNAVLSDMKRKYKVQEFETVCDHLLKSVPGVRIATDFICGFPTEKEEDHKESLQLLDKYRFDTTNISQFYPRPKTVAAKMKKLDSKIVKSRSREMTKLFKSYVTSRERIGEIHNVLITEMAKDCYHFVGHNQSYSHFLVRPSNQIDLMGAIVSVEITQIGKYFIKSKVVDINRKQKSWVENKIPFRPSKQSVLSNNYVYILLFSLCVLIASLLTMLAL
eukprot:14020_1